MGYLKTPLRYAGLSGAYPTLWDRSQSAYEENIREQTL